MLPVSALSGAGIGDLRDALAQAEAQAIRRASDGRFRLAVDRSFTLTGAGTVVTGTVLSGQVALGDQILISPSGLSARVRGIHAQNRKAEQGFAGQRCALNLTGDGISRDAISRGQVALDPALRERLFPDGRLTGPANGLIYANAEVAGAARNMLRSVAGGA